MADPKVALELRIMSGPGGAGPSEGAEATGGAGRTSADIESEMRRRIDEMFNQLRDETRQQRSREREERVEREFNLREGLRRRRTQTQQQEREEQRAARQQQREEQIEREFNLRQRLREGAARPGQTPAQGGLRAVLAGAAAGGGVQGGLRAGLSSAVSSMTAGAALAPLAVTAGAVTVALAGLATAVYSVREAFQVSMLAPESAAALGRQRAARIQSQREMALRNQEQMVRLIDVLIEIEGHSRELRAAIVDVVLPRLLPILETISDAARLATALESSWDKLSRSFADKIPEPVKRAANFFFEPTIFDYMAWIIRKSADYMDKQTEDEKADMTARVMRHLNPIRQEEILNQRFRESRRARGEGERGDIL